MDGVAVEIELFPGSLLGDAEHPVFRAGEIVAGNVVVTATRTVQLRAISFEAVGVSFSKFLGKGRSKLHQKDEHFRDRLNFLGDPSRDVGTDLAAGVHNFPFQVPLPENTPMSISLNKNNGVKYWVEVIVFPLGRKSKGVKITRPLVVFPLVDFADFGAPSGRAEGSNGKKGLKEVLVSASITQAAYMIGLQEVMVRVRVDAGVRAKRVKGISYAIRQRVLVRNTEERVHHQLGKIKTVMSGSFENSGVEPGDKSVQVFQFMVDDGVLFPSSHGEAHLVHILHFLDISIKGCELRVPLRFIHPNSLPPGVEVVGSDVVIDDMVTATHTATPGGVTQTVTVRRGEAMASAPLPAMSADSGVVPVQAGSAGDVPSPLAAAAGIHRRTVFASAPTTPRDGPPPDPYSDAAIMAAFGDGYESADLSDLSSVST